MIRKIVLYLLTYILCIPKLLGNWFSVRILRRHLRYKLVKSFNSLGSQKFAIIAVYPGTGTFGSLNRQIRLFLELEYSVLVVLNKNSESKIWEQKLKDLDCAIIHRNNLGADFGAYKLGINYIKQRYGDSITEITLANDSLFYTPDSISKLKGFLNDSSKFNCLFFHKQGIRHAGSMLVRCDISIVKQEKFWKFWKSYYPYALKKQVVRKGEHNFSRMVGLDYFQPMVGHGILFDSVVEFEPEEMYQAITWSKRSNMYIHDQVAFACDSSDYSRILEICLSNLQISNSLGLWISRNLQLPFKLDLPQFALCTIQDLLRVAGMQGCEDEEIQELRKVLEGRQNVTEGSLLVRTLGFLD
jgi:hypothetical protein